MIGHKPNVVTTHGPFSGGRFTIDARCFRQINYVTYRGKRKARYDKEWET
jgi:hypothetical protein